MLMHCPLQELEEFSVRISYVELYNEELFDLLAANTEDSTARLRLFEDPMRKGSVIIHGMEEVVVRNREEVAQVSAFSVHSSWS